MEYVDNTYKYRRELAQQSTVVLRRICDAIGKDKPLVIFSALLAATATEFKKIRAHCPIEEEFSDFDDRCRRLMEHLIYTVAEAMAEREARPRHRKRVLCKP
jgi:hypothetical protein